MTKQMRCFSLSESEPIEAMRSKVPVWSNKVARFHQLDDASFLCLELQSRIVQAAPWFQFSRSLILSSPSGCYDADRSFVKGGCKSPSKFVHTLPNVRASSFVEALGGGFSLNELWCFQMGEATLSTSVLHALESGIPSNILGFTLTNTPYLIEIAEYSNMPEFSQDVLKKASLGLRTFQVSDVALPKHGQTVEGSPEALEFYLFGAPHCKQVTGKQVTGKQVTGKPYIVEAQSTYVLDRYFLKAHS